MSKNQFGYDAYLDFLTSFRISGDGYFLGGGQAVNFWAEFITTKAPDRTNAMFGC